MPHVFPVAQTESRTSVEQLRKNGRPSGGEPDADVLYSSALGGFGIVSDDNDSAQAMVETGVRVQSNHPSHTPNEATTVTASNDECDAKACATCASSGTRS